MILYFSSCVTIQGLTDKLIDIIESTCTVENPKYYAARKFSPYTTVKEPQFLKYYHIDRKADMAVVPRGFPFNKYHRFFKDAEIVDERQCNEASFPDLRLNLTISQKYTVSKVMSCSNDVTGCYLVVLPTSKGKTIASLALAERLQQKTLILVNREIIYDGWFNDIEKAYGIPKKDIGRIRGKEWKIGDQFTVAMTQSFTRRKKYWKDVWSEVGCIITDECQDAPCQTISEILEACPAKYRIGLSATPTRKDKMHKVIYLQFGEPFVVQEVESDTTRTSVPIREAEIVETDFYHSNPSDYQDFITSLISNVPRNDVIIKKVIEEASNGEVVAVTTVRRDHAKYLTKMIGEHVDCDCYIGSEGNKESEENKSIVDKFRKGRGKVVVSTSKKIGTGSNIPSLSALIMTIPHANHEEVIQQMGRVRRRFEGKESAKVVYFYDSMVWRARQIYGKYFKRACKHMRIPGW